MIELDPTIMKRSLPQNVYATIDQVTANVNAAVDEIVNQFVANASKAVEKIERGDFTPDIAKALDQAKQDLNTDIKSMDDRLLKVASAVAQANALAQQANLDTGALVTQLAAVNSAAGELKTDLNNFRTKVDTFATKSGGFIASSALKAAGIG